MIKTVEIINAQKKTLRGYLNSPDNYIGTLVVFFHGFTGNLTEHGGMFRNFSRIISEYGFASLRCDFSGNGESDGNFCDFTYDTLISDATVILDYAKSLSHKKIVLLGYSMGGAVAAYLAARWADDIERLLLWSPAGNLSNLIKKRYENASKQTNGNIDCPNFELSKKMYDTLSKYDWHDGLGKYKSPVKIIHGRLDQAVDYLESYRYCGLFPNATVYIIEGAGHGYDRRTERTQLFKKSLEFLRGSR